MGKVIGIDLGTTNSCVAVVEGARQGRRRSSRTPKARARRRPSSAFAKDGERLVGQVAKRQAVTNAKNTVYAVKRLMGRKFDEEVAEADRRSSPYKIVEAPNGDAWVDVGGREMSPPEVSAMVLAKMKEIAETLPRRDGDRSGHHRPRVLRRRAAPGDQGRRAHRRARRQAHHQRADGGRARVRPRQERRTRRIVVYDLGGGTFDISILEIADGVFRSRRPTATRTSAARTSTSAIIDWLADEFESEHGVDLRKDRMALQRLKEAAEKAKHELSSSLETEINLPFIAADAEGPKHLDTQTITRAELELAHDDLVERTLEPVPSRRSRTRSSRRRTSTRSSSSAA